MHPDQAEGTEAAGGARTAPRRRAWGSWLAAGAVLALAGAAWAVWAHVWARPSLQGAVVTPPAPTYDFSLRDQDQRVVRLSALRGKAVALTFLYTHCPDICPLIANKMHEAYRQLGPAAARVALLAISVDPNGDTPEAVRTFLSSHRVVGELTYLTGSFAELKPVWAHYYIGTDAKEVNAGAEAVTPSSPDFVSHSAIVYVLDPRGNLRVFLPGNFDPQDLATDLRILASEPAR